ncbi:uncharacterized protein LOC135387147 [Ornithodoros turicata]|uniref:uncharacterized protein LOC135387147 n=1 Tax=Ornithodoros turicata TaxID=34597 RepID=UPI00313914F0
MSCYAIASPPPFLPTPGQLDVPWHQWKLGFLNYLEAMGGDDLTAKRRKAILLNALGLEGQRVFYSIPTDSRMGLNTEPSTSTELPQSSGDVFEEAMLALDLHYKVTRNVLLERHRFRGRRQLSGVLPKQRRASLWLCYYMVVNREQGSTSSDFRQRHSFQNQKQKWPHCDRRQLTSTCVSSSISMQEKVQDRLTFRAYVRVRKPMKDGKAAPSFTDPLKIVKQKGAATFLLEDRRTWNSSKLVKVPLESLKQNRDSINPERQWPHLSKEPPTTTSQQSSGSQGESSTKQLGTLH